MVPFKSELCDTWGVTRSAQLTSRKPAGARELHLPFYLWPIEMQTGSGLLSIGPEIRQGNFFLGMWPWDFISMASSWDVQTNFVIFSFPPCDTHPQRAYFPQKRTYAACIHGQILWVMAWKSRIFQVIFKHPNKKLTQSFPWGASVFTLTWILNLWFLLRLWPLGLGSYHPLPSCSPS